MAFKMTDPIMGSVRGTAAICYAHAQKVGGVNLPQIKRYVDEIYRLGPLVGIDSYVLYTQAVHETGDWSSDWWAERLNPAGIGITGDDSQNNASKTWPNGEAAARSHVAHMLMYTLGVIDRGGLTNTDDPRYRAYVTEYGNTGIAKLVRDLENTWGIDDGYAEAMERRGNEIWSAVPNVGATQTPPVPVVVDTYKPRIIDRWLHVAQAGYPAVERRYIGRNGMTPKIIVIHIQEGWCEGSWQWFHETTASSTVMAAHNGDIWRLVPESDGPWTNGDVNVPSALGRQILNKWGPDPNPYTLSIENEGFSYETHSVGDWEANKSTYAKQLKSNVWQVKQWMAKYRIELIYVIRHKDISTVGKPMCPGDAFFNALVAALKGDGSLPPVVELPAGDIALPSGTYAKPEPVPGFDGTKDVIVNNTKVYADKQTVTVEADQLFVRQFGSRLSSSTRDPLVKGQTFQTLGWVRGEKVDGEDRWWITASSQSRVWVGGTKEKPNANPAPTPDDNMPEQLPNGLKIVNGIVFYPAYKPNSFEPREMTVDVSDATVRDQPSTKGKKVRKVVKDDKFVAKYWCVGEDVKGERIWWLLDNGTDDPFTKPQFIWMNVSEERPD